MNLFIFMKSMMNVDHYKSAIYQMLEELKKAVYMDWLKAYLCINVIYGSVQLIPALLLLTQNVSLLLFVELFATAATQIVITTISSCIIAASFSFICFKYMPRFFVAFTLFKDILLSIPLTMVIVKDLPLSLFIGILGILSFVANLAIMLGFTYLLFKLVIRSIKKREIIQNSSFNQ